MSFYGMKKGFLSGTTASSSTQEEAASEGRLPREHRTSANSSTGTADSGWNQIMLEAPIDGTFTPEMVAALKAKLDSFENNPENENGGSNKSNVGDTADMVNKLLNGIKGGQKVERITMADYMSASTLLHLATTDGVRKREEMRKRKGDAYIGREDPVSIHMWSLTMKLRQGPEQAQEALQQGILDRLLFVLKKVDPQKYVARSQHIHQNNSFPSATNQERLLAKELSADQCDMHNCASVLHELCRYRSGCLALAENQKCLDFLLHDIPSKAIIFILSGLMTRDYGPRQTKDGNVNWESWLTYHIGLVEQATMDTMGRLLNGLDRHPALRKKIAKKFKQRELSPFHENKIRCWNLILLPMARLDPALTHCVDLQGTWNKLHELVSAILDKKPAIVKKWTSTFLLERELVDDPRKVMGEDDKLATKRDCQKCGKKPEGNLKHCSRWYVRFCFGLRRWSLPYSKSLSSPLRKMRVAKPCSTAHGSASYKVRHTSMFCVAVDVLIYRSIPKRTPPSLFSPQIGKSTKRTASNSAVRCRRTRASIRGTLGTRCERLKRSWKRRRVRRLTMVDGIDLFRAGPNHGVWASHLHHKIWTVCVSQSILYVR